MTIAEKAFWNCGFDVNRVLFLVSHDVTEIQTTKLSILLKFDFHDVLEQLKTNVYINFRFKRVLCFYVRVRFL